VVSSRLPWLVGEESAGRARAPRDRHALLLAAEDVGERAFAAGQATSSRRRGRARRLVGRVAAELAGVARSRAR